MIEAWLAGVPVCCTPGGAVQELERRFGPMTTPIDDVEDADAMAAAVRRALSPEGRRRSKRARQVALEVLTAEAMRERTFNITPMSMISRARAGARGKTLIVNLPGNPRAVRETLEVILPVLVHTVEVLQNRRGPHPVDGSSEAPVDAPVDVEEA